MMRRRPRLAALVILLPVVLLAGCGPKPRAPVLRDDPVYQNDQEGFRFLAPEGWQISSRSDAPPGRLTKELVLVNYRTSAGKGASFIVTMDDLPPAADLTEKLTGPSYGVTKWKLTSSPEAVKAGAAEAFRHQFAGRVGKEDRVKEVVSVRRGERVYFFQTIYSPSEKRARDQGRRIVDSLIWKK